MLITPVTYPANLSAQKIVKHTEGVLVNLAIIVFSYYKCLETLISDRIGSDIGKKS